jgi:hypothetical protein
MSHRETMKRRDITEWQGAMLLLSMILLIGMGGCADKLLPPPAGGSETGRELLVYVNEIAMIESAIDEPDLGRTMIIAKRPDGTGQRVIASGLISSAPQNGRIAYFYEDTSGVRPSGIYVANDDGSDSMLFEPLDFRSDAGLNPWSVTLGPDGASVAWVAVDEFGYASLVVRTPSHRWETPLDFITSNPYALSVPRFSPDGTYVAYAIITDTPGISTGSIKLLQTSTGYVREIPASIMPTYSGIMSPPFDWAPDSRRILYAGVFTDSFVFSSELMVTNIATGLTDTLMRDSMIKESPRWLPGGNQICYVALTENGGADLFLRESTGEVRRLTYEESSLKVGLSISPDGRTALYTEFLNFDDLFGTVRSFDLIRRVAGPVLATNTDMGHWRQ